MRHLGGPMNPVLARELKERMRTRRSTVVLVIWLALLTLLLSVVYQAKAAESVDVMGGPLATQSAAIGRTVFESLIILMLVLVVLVVPGLTADAITGERERQTLVPLQVTLLRPRSIVAGKLFASIAFVALLVIVSTPLLGVAYVLGGVTMAQLAAGVMAVLGTAVLVACISIFSSSVAGRTQGAVVLSLFLVLLLSVGGPSVYLAQRVFDDDHEHPPTHALLVSPFFATAHAVGDDTSTSSPLGSVRSVIERKRLGDGRFVQQRVGPNGRLVLIDQNGNVIANGEDRERPGGPPFWARSAAMLALVALLAFVGASRRLRTPSDRSAA